MPPVHHGLADDANLLVSRLTVEVHVTVVRVTWVAPLSPAADEGSHRHAATDEAVVESFVHVEACRAPLVAVERTVHVPFACTISVPMSRGLSLQVRLKVSDLFLRYLSHQEQRPLQEKHRSCPRKRTALTSCD